MSLVVGSTRALGLFAALLMCLSFLGGCKKSEASPKPIKTCTTSAQCDPGERCDEETSRCVPGCGADNQCKAQPGTRCDLPSGKCVAAETCRTDAHCGRDAAHDYCKDETCFCVPDESVAGGESEMTGICWRPAQTCEPCEKSVECGEGPAFLNKEGACKVFYVDGAEANVCLPKVSRACPAGTITADESIWPDLKGMCVPQSGDCSSLEPCREDTDCRSEEMPVCDPVRQICIPGCTFDIVTKRTVGCSPGRVCHADPRGYDAGLLDRCETAHKYGVGSCGPTCRDDDDCDDPYVCLDDGGGKRCRPKGCVHDLECTTQGGAFAGYCDVAAGECVFDACRLGTDPRLGCESEKSFDDCAPAYKCEGDPRDGVGDCVEMNCLEQGGARTACNRGNFCAGEPFRDPVTRQPVDDRFVEIPDGEEAGICYPMDLPTWCTAECEKADDCAGYDAPTNYPNSPHYCGTFGLPGKQCFWGCEYQEDCPVDWTCSSKDFEVQCGFYDDGGIQLCRDDSDCGGGSTCTVALYQGEPILDSEGEPRAKVCTCTDSLACSPGYTCNAGIGTARTVPGEPGFEEVQARYCSDSSRCGSGGSCEWLGEEGIIPDSGFPPLASPISRCMVAPPSMVGVEATCPDRTNDGIRVRPGRTFLDQYQCVITSICQPGYTPKDPLSETPLVCEAL